MSKASYVVILFFISLLLSGCTPELLHFQIPINVVPETTMGAEPFYAQLPQPSPILVEIPDTVTVHDREAGDYLLKVLPYYGVAIWKIDSTTTIDIVELGFISLPGMLSYVYYRDSTKAILSQATAHYEVDFSTQPPSISDQLSVPPVFDPYYYLPITATASTTSNKVSYYFNCPNPDSILAGFRQEILNTPSCRF